ncbi:sigma factor-like helix-turn-helix DNA-binding protein [Streptomyces sp. HUAS TT7]|uniref:sigma factor-like helix-turn-helix DNA-binding protein n=1 Tax=Streptomyces sp. HUAS TT7 TaxID=3447507 RepID=UPI003F658D01
MTQSTADTNDTGARPPLPTPKERRRLREAKDLSEAQIATAIGVTRATVRSWETGRTTPRGRKGDTYARLLATIEAEMAAVADQDDLDDDDGNGSGSGSGSGSGEQDAARPATAARTKPVKGKGTEQPAKPHAANTRPKPAAKKAAKPPATPHARHEHTAPAPAPAASVSVPAKEALTSGAPTGGAAHVVPEQPPEPEETEAAEPDGALEAPAPPADPDPGQTTTSVPHTAAEAFDALYCSTASGLARQAYLLTGRTRLSRESVERAFHLAWENWPEVATDRDPAGWVRAAAYEYAMAPWHRFRRAHKHPDQPPNEPERRALLDALLDLPPAYRRTVLLYDGLGLDLPETAAETEASTPAAASRLLQARDAIARRVPAAAGAKTPEALSSVLRERIADLAAAGPASVTALPSAPVVRTGSERRRRFWTRAAIAFTTLIVGATMFTVVTVPHFHVRPVPPGERVAGVPAISGPQRLTGENVELRDKLRTAQGRGPHRLVPNIR